MPKTTTLMPLVVIAAVTLVLYAWGVAENPAYLYVDEVAFALQAHSIATTGHDVNGRLMPLYFQMRWVADNSWFHPVIVYVMALFLMVLPVTESVIRWPSVVVGVIDVVLMYFVARRLFPGRWQAIFAAALLAFTPAHFIHARIAMDYLYPVPFVLAWLLCLLIFVDRKRFWILFLATSFLGLGFYSYIASVLMMPLYLLLTCVTLAKTTDTPLRACLVATAGFTWPLLAVVLWLSFHPDIVVETLNRYGIRAENEPFGFSDLTGRISVYWSFFDPAFLFVTGGYAHMVNSTRRVGVFLLPLLVFVPVGLIQLAAFRRTRVDHLLLLGFASAPLAACLLPERYAIDRELVVLPFAILLATYGVQHLLASRQRLWRMTAVGLLALLPLHFAFFYADYWRDYPSRAAYRFQGNRRGALEEIIGRSPAGGSPAIYLNRHRIPYVDAHWQLYLLKHHRPDLLQHTVYFDSNTLDVSLVPPGSLLLTTLDDAPLMARVQPGQLQRLANFPEPGNPPLFGLFTR